ncbi:hypothetical protein AB1Y20_007189 [Prymnesium parvum]|uniref:RRM domain-containing protein n=1 Tax=Prymnesium parvum TaxID=97485 RepID=A0AB34IVD5_PRYPA
MISTICIRGLPNDLRRRELRNLVAFIPGYQVVSLSRGEGKPTTGFARFSTPEQAQHAQSLLNGYTFDEEDRTGRGLSVEIARRDLDDKPPHASASGHPRGPPDLGSSRPSPSALGYAHNLPPQGHGYRDAYRDNYRDSGRDGGRDSYRDGGRDSYRDGGRDSYRDGGRDSYRDGGRDSYRDGGRDSYRDSHGEGYRDGGMGRRDELSEGRKRSRFDNGENNNDTICIRMIPVGCSEDEVRDLFVNFDGYRGHKLLPNATNSQTQVCFVLFEKSRDAQDAIRLLQGLELEGSRGNKMEITIEMARRSLQLNE